MKTDIHLLWIDDNRDFVDGKKPHLSKWLEDQGFGLDVHFQKNATGAIPMLKQQDIALVILDYHLGKRNGDLIIQDFRSQGLYQDIVFYSQDFGAETFGQMDGVFKVVRNDVETRIKRLLELRIRSASDFATFRGWFLADSIELEIIIGRIIPKFFGNHETQFKKRVLEEDHWWDFAKKYQLLNGLVKDRVAELSAAKDANFAALSACRTILKKFVDEVIHPRNGLAHQ
jgi:CheY-like chemotaxis protein